MTANNPFRSVKVSQGFYQGNVVHWELDPSIILEVPFSFTLEASETPQFTELVLSKDVGDSFYATDDTRKMQSKGSSYLYRVKLVTPKDTFYSISINYDYTGCTRHQYLQAREATRLELKRMQYTGFNGWLIKRKVYTPVDPIAIDPVSGTPLTDQSSSFGTGLLGGYYDPIKVRFSREDHAENIELNPDGSGVTQKFVSKLRFVGFPPTGPRDIVVMDDDTRHIISANQTRFYPGTPIVLVQNVDVRLVPVTDPVYQIPVPEL